MCEEPTSCPKVLVRSLEFSPSARPEYLVLGLGGKSGEEGVGVRACPGRPPGCLRSHRKGDPWQEEKERRVCMCSCLRPSRRWCGAHFPRPQFSSESMSEHLLCARHLAKNQG